MELIGLAALLLGVGMILKYTVYLNWKIYKKQKADSSHTHKHLPARRGMMRLVTASSLGSFGLSVLLDLNISFFFLFFFMFAVIALVIG